MEKNDCRNGERWIAYAYVRYKQYAHILLYIVHRWKEHDWCVEKVRIVVVSQHCVWCLVSFYSQYGHSYDRCPYEQTHSPNDNMYIYIYIGNETLANV